jgi:hypothetical protein
MNKVMFYIKQKIWQYKKYKLRVKKIKMSQLEKIKSYKYWLKSLKISYTYLIWSNIYVLGNNYIESTVIVSLYKK